MVAHNQKMNCPKCGFEMNHHADKLLYESSVSQLADMDPELGGIVEEVYQCPACGAGASCAAIQGIG